MLNLKTIYIDFIFQTKLFLTSEIKTYNNLYYITFFI